MYIIILLDSISVGCLNIGVYLSSSSPSFAPCLEDICAGGGGGSVAIEGFVLYIRGDYSCTLNAMLLVQYVRRRVAM